MKKKLIGIYEGALCYPPEFMHHWDERNLKTGGIGGSEVWAIELASQFEKTDEYHAVVFADCETWHFAPDGVEYIPMNLFESCAKLQHYDTMIVSRYPSVLSYSINADKIYLMIHDGYALNCDSYEELHMEKVQKICVQSDFQKETLKNRYQGLTDEDFFYAFQGVPLEKYENTPKVEKKNRMLWSSHKIRGSKFLIERVLPLIRKEVPDFEVDVCGYIKDTHDSYFNAEGVNVLGCLEKDELIRKQLEAKIWIYPNWGMYENGAPFDETFCITAVENGMAGNALLLAGKGCFPTTLKGYEYFTGTDLFPKDSLILENEEAMDAFAHALAEHAIKCLKDEEYRAMIAKQTKDICDFYTWENVRERWISEINTPYINKLDSMTNLNESNIKSVVVLDVIDKDESEALTYIRKRCDELNKLFASIPNIYFVWGVCITDNINYTDAMNAISANINPKYGWSFNCGSLSEIYNTAYGVLSYIYGNFFMSNNNEAWVFHGIKEEDIYKLPQIIEQKNKCNLEGTITFRKLNELVY